MNMAKTFIMNRTGIKKYDQLPQKVGIIDIHLWRYRYNKYKEEYLKAKQILDEAVKEHKNNG